jgi:GGDEF domain-containing protein
MVAQPQRMKFVNYYEDAVQKLKASGITEDQIERLRDFGLMARDSVTGFHEGRSGVGRFATLRLAIQHVKETGEEAYYVEMDLRNLSGLNAVLGHSGANEVFSIIANIVRRELSAIASDVTYFRHGGDEMSAFLIDTTESALRKAFFKINRQIGLLAKAQNLDAIPHPKHEGDDRYNGVGIYFGISQILPHHEADPAVVFSTADQIVEHGKLRVVG